MYPRNLSTAAMSLVGLFMPDEKWSFKCVHILENLIDIFLINDVIFHPPATYPL